MTFANLLAGKIVIGVVVFIAVCTCIYKAFEFGAAVIIEHGKYIYCMVRNTLS